MHGRAAEPQPADRRAIPGKLRQRAHPQRLVKLELRLVRLTLRPLRVLDNCSTNHPRDMHTEQLCAERRIRLSAWCVLYMRVRLLAVGDDIDPGSSGSAPVLHVVIGALDIVE